MKNINKVLPPLVYDEVEGKFSFSPVEFLDGEKRGRNEAKKRKRKGEGEEEERICVCSIFFSSKNKGYF